MSLKPGTLVVKLDNKDVIDQFPFINYQDNTARTFLATTPGDHTLTASGELANLAMWLYQRYDLRSTSVSFATVEGHLAPNVSMVLNKYPNLAAAIKWQATPASSSNAYLPPQPGCMVAYSNWTSIQKGDLQAAFLDSCKWFADGAPQVLMDPNTLSDEPVNIHPNVTNDAVTAMQSVSPDYMWRLYIAHVGFSLAAEYTGQFPWSISRCTSEQLRYLFDSTTMAWNIFGTRFGMGTYHNYVPPLRADNLPKTAFAPPKWTYPFLKQAGLIGTTQLDTICRVLEWMRQNMRHDERGPNGQGGTDTFGSYDAVWQYRGFPPLSKIVAGTVDSNNPGLGLQHWTAGCHGSVGFLNAVLRAVNIPMQPVWVCAHEIAFFMTEKMYLDHGDDPYNSIVKNSSQPISNLLIDEATYRSRFSNYLTVNITDQQSPACANVGLAADQFPP
jgi:hypothetical protein